MGDVEAPANGLGKKSELVVLEPAAGTMLVPAMVAAAGRARGFFSWLDERDIRELGAIRTHHVSAYIETLTRTYKAPTVNQHLAAIRMLIVGQVVDQNPAAVRGPKHVVKKGKTPVLDGDEARLLSLYIIRVHLRRPPYERRGLLPPG
jgi:hypothetical protein